LYHWSCDIGRYRFMEKFMKGIRSLAVCSAVLLSACTSTGVNNTAGRATVYEDVRTSSPIVQGVGIESQDIVAMTDRMMRDMLSTEVRAGAPGRTRFPVLSQRERLAYKHAHEHRPSAQRAAARCPGPHAVHRP